MSTSDNSGIHEAPSNTNQRAIASYNGTAALLIVALLGALLHMAPVWRAQAQTPPGWTFTGIISGSPDMMMYRIVTRRSQEIGPIVDNTLTTEPNSPYIPVFLYYGIGKMASWLDVPAAFVLNYSGMVFTFVLILLLYWIVHHFLRIRYRTWWVLLVLLVGGGLGAHLKLIAEIPPLAQNFLVKRTVVEGLENAIVFDQYRNHYIFNTLFDTHYTFFLIIFLLAIGGFYFALRRFSYLRLAIAAVLFAAATVLHIYDGVTLLSIAAGTSFLLWRKRRPLRPALILLGVCTFSVATAILWQLGMNETSGIPIPAWRADAIYASELILAYPIAWGLMAWGLGDYWRKAGFEETFLLGWVLGCVTLILAGPFYPYPDRGNLSLQIPLYIIAGQIFFASQRRVRASAVLLLVAILGATPAYVLFKKWRDTSFASHPSGSPAPYIWMSPAHQELLNTLERQASANDVLIVDKTKVPWRTDDLWLAPSFPGKLYAGYYFFTVDYDRKREEVSQFYAAGDPEVKAQFLRDSGARFVYASPEQAPDSFEDVPGLVTLLSSSAGTLFEFRPDP